MTARISSRCRFGLTDLLNAHPTNGPRHSARASAQEPALKGAVSRCFSTICALSMLVSPRVRCMVSATLPVGCRACRREAVQEVLRSFGEDIVNELVEWFNRWTRHTGLTFAS